MGEVRIYQELPEWLVEAVRPPDDPRTFEQALAQLIGENAQLREAAAIRETPEDDSNLECTHCGGEGLCWDGSDPLGNCPDDPHRCHACAGSGKRKDQTIF